MKKTNILLINKGIIKKIDNNVPDISNLFEQCFPFCWSVFILRQLLIQEIENRS